MFKFIKKLKPSQATLGVEITDNSIKLVEIAAMHKNAYTLKKFLIEKLPDKVIDDGRIKDPLRVIHTLQNMISKMNIKTKQVHVVLPSQLIMVRFLKLPDIPVKDLSKLVDFEMKHNIHLPFEDPLYDFIKLNENELNKEKKPKSNKIKVDQYKGSNKSDLAAKEAAVTSSDRDRLFEDHVDTVTEENVPLLQCDVMLVAAPKELIEEYEEIFSATSLSLLSMEFKALSLFRLVEFTKLAATDSTFMTIDINDQMTDVSIFYKSQLKITRNIPMNFASDAHASQDDETNVTFLRFMDQDTDFKNVCNDLSYEIERLMNFYRYSLNNRDQEFSQILVTGDVFRLSDIVDNLNERLMDKVTLMYSEQIHSRYPLFSEVFPSIAVPLGLALRGNER